MLLPCEKEVVLNIDDETKTWTASVSSPSFMKIFDNSNWKCTKIDYDKDHQPIMKFYEAPKNAIKIKDPTKKRQVTEEQRLAAKERFEKMWEDKKKNE